MVLSAIFGLVFTFFVARGYWTSGAAVVSLAVAYGLLLWIVNVLMIDANLIPAGLSLAPTPLMIVVHLVYGLVLGLVLAPKLSSRAAKVAVARRRGRRVPRLRRGRAVAPG